MKIMKVLKKIKKVISRFCIKQIAHLDSNLYTKKYTQHLKKYGMNIQGIPRYIATTATFDGNDYSIIHLGNDCVISSEVQFLTHDYSIARGLQAIGKNNPIPNKDELFLKGIYVGENSFIGTRSTLLPGTHIGKNVIVGACSVVKGTIPDNSIVIGNPSKIILNTKEWAEKKYIENEYFIEK
ncbi:bacterial transferase hexapeptide family protein [[Clostridium] sordellii ATCC 9714]|nr:acyltransferase [Paeniclostridium sordellii]EPZ59912.1 bacterial transferase hexapeptide family protein [[Clostridium] sordellii ATCC 9714] [Paeniclostridium sordellii ATCC 9714]